ncbi:hypothetical protein AVEN_202580-1 [Araneus ventricosus]|uniref:Tc1-like transposase DDE domain-containing protein n=1 Tax=Araneus ventricosus TaxID=182803 RepID=A0A4Y2HD20_ARAVE|nr:hypothetical protein AVEN_85476-1 [Araneus ventricosus]GBM63168.1 hypothetical protein AVEN_202580-1 [Araneus ventricosus]
MWRKCHTTVTEVVCNIQKPACLEPELSSINTQTVILVLQCPPYSPDLNPCVFFLWGHMKDLVYKKKPTDLISLKRSITDTFARKKNS